MSSEHPLEPEMSLPDLLQEGLELLFVGINPGLTSARLGHYYAGPGNLFWRCLHESALIPERLTYREDRRVLEWGIGITDCVKRPSRMASEVRAGEFRTGAPELRAKIAFSRPRIICFNGLMGYRSALDPEAGLGLQPEPLEGALVFVVPSTSAANANFTREERVEWFRKVRRLRDRVREWPGNRPFNREDILKLKSLDASERPGDDGSSGGPAEV